MIEHVFEALAMGGLLTWGAIMAGTVLYDVLRHEPEPAPRSAVRTGVTPGGVPYVHGLATYETEQHAARQPDAFPEAVHAPQLRDRLPEPVAAPVAAR